MIPQGSLHLMVQDSTSIYIIIVGLLKGHASSWRNHLVLQAFALKGLETTDAEHLFVHIHLGSAQGTLSLPCNLSAGLQRHWPTQPLRRMSSGWEQACLPDLAYRGVKYRRKTLTRQPHRFTRLWDANIAQGGCSRHAQRPCRTSLMELLEGSARRASPATSL